MPNGPLKLRSAAQPPCGFVDRPRKRPAHKLHKANTKRRQKRTHDVLQSADIFTRYGHPRAEPNVEWLIQAKRGAEARVERSRQDICRRCLRDRCIV